jgi:hypothetical protein
MRTVRADRIKPGDRISGFLKPGESLADYAIRRRVIAVERVSHPDLAHPNAAAIPGVEYPPWVRLTYGGKTTRPLQPDLPIEIQSTDDEEADE